ncbi:hypothetical protein GCM10011369_05860 [Neiella marina]|uniref:Uncharacterized protein n=1 Tax=Neiella marina TaxID=508461 RepID=A0A8J2XMV6_9GAMM|nr:hypothetical protein [Neiella marina]GGA67071.1 hypothetical protein GCM10011369_05860 [Neiella marina]
MATKLLSKLKASARPENLKDNPLLRNRERLLKRLNQQLDLAKLHIEGKPLQREVSKRIKDEETGEMVSKTTTKVVRPWFYTRNNCLYFEVKHNNQPLEIAKGMHAFEVGPPENLIPTIETVIEAVVAGELDNFLEPAK